MTAEAELVYLSLGSNIGNSFLTLTRTLELIKTIPDVHLLDVSDFYRTTPVSSIPQRDFLNAACTLKTTLPAHDLYHALHEIEILLGKIPKEKNAPRPIDIDILFFGNKWYQTKELCIPHPHWKERLFVLIPLLDLTEKITFPLDEKGNCQTIVLKEYLKKQFTSPMKDGM